MRKKPAKPYWEMNTRELATATKEFERDFVLDTFGPPPPRARADWAKALRKRGSIPKPDRQTIRVTIDRELLTRADGFARRHGLSRGQLIMQSVETFIDGRNGKQRR